MGINLTCPISGEKRDNSVVRVVSALVLIIITGIVLLAVLISPQIAAIVGGLLTIDFIIRGFIKPKYSILGILARIIASGLNLPKDMVDNGPKVFAARVGVVFSLVITILYGLNLFIPGTVVLSILVICAVLESVFSFCVGCFVYSLFPPKIGCILAKEFFK